MRIIPIKSIFLSESQSTSQVRPVSLLCFTGGETEVGIGWGTGLCIWQHVGQARGQTQRVSHALLPPHPDHYSKTCPLSASSRYMLLSSHSVPLGEELCNSPQVAHLPHRKELIAKLSLWRRESHHSVLNKEDVEPVIPGSIWKNRLVLLWVGRTVCHGCLCSQEIFFAAFESWWKWIWFTELPRCIALWHCAGLRAS